MLALKIGVKVGGLRPELIIALVAAESALSRRGVTCVVTSAWDGKHRVGSKHYAGLAVDLRTRDLGQNDQEAVRVELAAALGADFDVILESDHLHIEFDPKPETQIAQLQEP